MGIKIIIRKKESKKEIGEEIKRYKIRIRN